MSSLTFFATHAARTHSHRLAAASLVLCAVTGLADPNSDLLAAAKAGNMSKVQEALSKGADINARDKNGYTAIMHAVGFGHPNADILALLLEKKADPNAALPPASGWGGYLPKKGGSPSAVVALLLAAGADRRVAAVAALERFQNGSQLAVTGQEMTALMMASFRGDSVAVARLIAAGADLNIKSKEGFTALMFGVLETPTDALVKPGATAVDLATPGSVVRGLFEK